ncbi:glycosyltransferase family 4 protein [Clostridium diolis]|uniref:glycosyltransferase family 4 protein n=1 Tax=Clostridium diolis TaxID=223919 RepID=UPI003AF58A2D
MNILIVRNAANKVNPNSYNLQEIGLGRALIKKEINCDIVYSNDKGKSYKEEIDRKGDISLNILWTKVSYKIFNNAIYSELLKKNFYDKYDVVILTEYTQVMTYLISNIIPEKSVLYQGPYKDSKKIVQTIYDLLFLNKIKNNVRMVFTKSKLAEEYMKSKGFNKIFTIGVGFNIENIICDNSNKNEENNLIIDIKKQIKGKKVLLYIGVFEERRNIKFLIDVFNNLRKEDKNIVLLLIGNGKNKDQYFEYIDELGIKDSIVYINKVEQKDLKQIHDLSTIFLLPTKYEIYGMVLLESMYLGTPVITSLNGGSSMLIENEETGYILDEFIVEKWSNKIKYLLSNIELQEKIKKKSRKRISEEFTWDIIAEKFLYTIRNNN